MNLTEEQIGTWAQAPSDAEDARCTNAISQTTDMLRAQFGNAVKLIRQGSHTNRTNVRVDSDVDMAVVHTNYFFGDPSFLSPLEKVQYQASFKPANYSFAQYKADVEQALRNKFGTSMVERKKKCLRVAGNTNRTSIDIVPAFEHHRFSSYGVVSDKGIEFAADGGGNINSFPEQHYDNGVAKNTSTARNFKSTVRILKRLRNRLIETELIGAAAMPSFFLESLVWNVPDSYFAQNTWRALASGVTAKIWNDMRNPEIATNYLEVCALRWLFRGSPQRSYAQAEAFMLQAWRYVTQ